MAHVCGAEWHKKPASAENSKFPQHLQKREWTSERKDRFKAVVVKRRGGRKGTMGSSFQGQGNAGKKSRGTVGGRQQT